MSWIEDSKTQPITAVTDHLCFLGLTAFSSPLIYFLLILYSSSNRVTAKPMWFP